MYYCAFYNYNILSYKEKSQRDAKYVDEIIQICYNTPKALNSIDLEIGGHPMITYQPLFDELKEKNMKLRDLMISTGIAPNTMTRIRKNKTVSMEILVKFCSVLKCDFKDIISYIPEDEI